LAGSKRNTAVDRFQVIFLTQQLAVGKPTIGASCSLFARRRPAAGNPVDAQDDVVAAVVRWVEQGIAPDKIIASHFTNGVVDTSRPLCPYPEVALHKAAGSTSDAGNFVCVGDREQAGQ
jgi:feruloyl esterase